MSGSPLKSLAEYSGFIAEVLAKPSIERSTVTLWSDSRYTGIAEGEVFFKSGIRLRMREEIDFDAALIVSYGYEVYLRDERLYWYDDFPHPQDASLRSTFPHHKHVPPNIRRNRIPAPGLSFERANLPAILQEIEQLGF